mgnify:CR=1 FL=1
MRIPSLETHQQSIVYSITIKCVLLSTNLIIAAVVSSQDQDDQYQVWSVFFLVHNCYLVPKIVTFDTHNHIRSQWGI